MTRHHGGPRATLDYEAQHAPQPPHALVWAVALFAAVAFLAVAVATFAVRWFGHLGVDVHVHP